MSDYHSLMLSHGFYLHEKCICSGVKIWKYRSVSENRCMDAKVFPDSKKYLISKNFFKVSAGLLTKLESELKRLC
jgi:hypothetical protein